ncbi:MAG TPA: MerR family transcriptional regulator [Bacteroidetes bacterium]|nr:MerR family transcriptional regulator [Bacteroidota bacterium]HDZ12930.1 MerR family transcriptional regulator [Bacteroidota bacterium]
MQNRPIKKLYYSISEVSELAGLKQHVLRYWETEFPELKPSKNRAGNRIYRPKDLELIQTIKKLLYEERYTIQGAREKIKSGQSHKDRESISIDPERVSDIRKIIEELRDDLVEIKNLLDSDGA